MAKIEVQCATCGRRKNVSEYQLRTSKTKAFFCNRECQGKWQSKRIMGENHPLYVDKIVGNCAWCGKEKVTNPSYRRTRENVFCNTQCQANWRKVNWKGRDCPLFVEKIVVNCTWCGKEKKVIPYLTTINERFFCDKWCQGQYKSIYQAGENCGAWKGGLSYEPYGSEFDEKLRRYIRDRDNHSCKLCGQPENGRKLSVHHVDYNKKNNAPGNLLSLCNSCHTLTNSNRDAWMRYFQNLGKFSRVPHVAPNILTSPIGG